MLGPSYRILNAVNLIEKQLELQKEILAADQQTLDKYKLKFPDKVLYINERQTILNQRAESLELLEDYIGFVPGLLTEEQNRQYHKGRQSTQQSNQRPEGYFYTEREKEALRAQSIYEAQQKYNF
jgi:hypothetical protein